jgi:indolepyruvate ferredoxin oxidoreductase
MSETAPTLDDKYDLTASRFYLTGTQALVRLPMLQRERDRRAGLATAGFVSGYRGSPLGMLDMQMAAAKAHLAEHDIVFKPGLNEDLAATAVWGTQQVTLFPGATVDGVFALWYGKGPGVDRSGDVLKHANFAGTARAGGVLVCAGDDHACKSSTVPHQSEQALAAASIPVLAPADVGDILELGLHGWAMSRWSGRYVGFKLVADVVDSSASVAFDLDTFRAVMPSETWPDVSIRLPDTPLAQEARLFAHGLQAAQDYVRANGLDRVVLPGQGARIGIVTAGKSYHDTRQALSLLGVDETQIRLLKLALVWPIDPQTVRNFAVGLDEIVVVEEKAALIEAQIRDVLYDLPARPRVTGKQAPQGRALLKPVADLSATEIAAALAQRLAIYLEPDRLNALAASLMAAAGRVAAVVPAAERKPFFCSGCPHNTSTKVIEGSRALAGIGCHYMAVWMDRNTLSFSQMGGEGAAWIGQSPFTEERHVFANLGDGTYFHSGLLAIRAAVAARVNITYKILFNDAVAMTGGQHVDGELSVPQITRQLAAEAVAAIAVVTDEPAKYQGVTGLAPGVEVFDRHDLPEVERRFRDTPGCTAIVYDQTCASEKRRRRKRGLMPDPAKRAFINAAVCEGCGDCSRQSNCISIVPEETPLGTRRRIDQSSCNKDFSCVDGFCPSFVTVEGGSLRRPQQSQPPLGLPEPAMVALDQPWSMLLTGVGGTGIVTVAALLGMAAHLDGLQVSVLDMLGLAQKGGAVFSHVRLARADAALHGLKLGQGQCDLLLGCDLVVAASREALATIRGAEDARPTRVVLNTHETSTAAFVLDPSSRLPGGALRRSVVAAAGEGQVDQLDATGLATALMGDAIAANLFLLGFAWQRGLVPLRLESLQQAIRLNGTAVAANLAAFGWGRAAAVDPAEVARKAGVAPERTAPETLDALIATRTAHLRAYQGRRLARRYTKRVQQIRAVEELMFSGGTALTEAVARALPRLLAVKDEYEVARLYTQTAFRAALDQQFEGDYRLRFHLAPPVLARRDPRTGLPQKRAFGPWMMTAFRVLAPLRVLRGTWLDPFARRPERRLERQVLAEYEAALDLILQHLSPATLEHAVALAGSAERVAGFGHVRERSIQAWRAARDAAVESLLAAARGVEQGAERSITGA